MGASHDQVRLKPDTTYGRTLNPNLEP